jgi:chromosome segregation ATPase
MSSGLTAGERSALDAIVALINNPEAVRQRIEALTKAYEEADAMVKLAAPASEIVALREKIQKEHDALANLRKEAEGVAAALRAKADTDARAIVAEAGKDADRIRAEAEKRMTQASVVLDSATSKDRAAEEKLAHADEMETAVTAQQASLAAQGAELTKRAEELATERTRLQAVRAQLQAAVG